MSLCMDRLYTIIFKNIWKHQKLVHIIIPLSIYPFSLLFASLYLIYVILYTQDNENSIQIECRARAYIARAQLGTSSSSSSEQYSSLCPYACVSYLYLGIYTTTETFLRFCLSKPPWWRPELWSTPALLRPRAYTSE